MKPATVLESLAAVCFESGNFAGSLAVYIDEPMRIEGRRRRSRKGSRRFLTVYISGLLGTVSCTGLHVVGGGMGRMHFSPKRAVEFYTWHVEGLTRLRAGRRRRAACTNSLRDCCEWCRRLRAREPGSRAGVAGSSGRVQGSGVLMNQLDGTSCGPESSRSFSERLPGCFRRQPARAWPRRPRRCHRAPYNGLQNGPQNGPQNALMDT